MSTFALMSESNQTALYAPWLPVSFQGGVLPGSQREASLGANLLLCGVAARFVRRAETTETRTPLFNEAASGSHP